MPALSSQYGQTSALDRIIAIAAMQSAGYPDDPALSIADLARSLNATPTQLRYWWEHREEIKGKSLDSSIYQAANAAIAQRITMLLPAILEEMTNPEKIAAASLSQLAVTAGIMVDKLHNYTRDQEPAELTIIHRLARGDALPAPVWEPDAQPEEPE